MHGGIVAAAASQSAATTRRGFGSWSTRRTGCARRAFGDTEAFIIGGAEIYNLAIHRADRMYLTRVHAEVEGDTWFPEFDDVSEWRLVDAEHYDADEKNEYPFSVLTYERAAPEGHAIPAEG